MLGVDTIGRIRKGNRADLIVFDADPTLDISAVRDVRLVMADGTIARNDLSTDGMAAGSTSRAVAAGR